MKLKSRPQCAGSCGAGRARNRAGCLPRRARGCRGELAQSPAVTALKESVVEQGEDEKREHHPHEDGHKYEHDLRSIRILLKSERQRIFRMFHEVIRQEAEGDEIGRKNEPVQHLRNCRGSRTRTGSLEILQDDFGRPVGGHHEGCDEARNKTARKGVA